ncbi:MAG TPA: peptidoglycan-binding protein [Candidatus Limnocylindrales bacterium]|nr:peptidoglycan-binding protein [Candidatus Limnocylindrales bacterium]
MASLGARRVARRVGGAVAGAVLVAAVAGVGWAVLKSPHAATPAPGVSTGTAPVTRGTVTERVQIAGVLGFDGRYRLMHQGSPGIVTWLAPPGAVVDRGGVLYAVANQPVRLLLGTIPAYREFAAGMPDGPDVRQLEENLAALGLSPGPVDQRFTAATATAIRHWQASSGVAAAQRTGALALGAVVFAPVVLRVAEATATVGMAIGSNEPVLAATSTDRVVIAPLPTDRQHLVHAGDEVRVSVSGAGAAVPATVRNVGQVADAPDASGSRDGGGGGGAATVTLTIEVDLPAGGPDLDRAPAQVAVTVATRSNVLLVPVVALLPRPGGGYQVRLPDGGYVQVQPGLFDSGNGTVEVTGELAEGQLVQVPAL